MKYASTCIPLANYMLIVISCILAEEDLPELLRRLRIQAMNSSSATAFTPRIEQLLTQKKDETLQRNFIGIKASDILNPAVQESLSNTDVDGVRSLDVMLKLAPIQEMVEDFRAKPTAEKAVELASH